MFGTAAFSDYAFSDTGAAEYAEAANVATFLAEITSHRCWLLEIDALSLASVEGRAALFGGVSFSDLSFAGAAGQEVVAESTLRYSTNGYRSHTSDSPAKTWYDGRMTDSIQVDRRVVGTDGVGGLASVFADAELLNLDGELDDLLDRYAVDGRAVRIKVGRPTDALADFATVFSGVATVLSAELPNAILKLSDGLSKLDCLLNETVYLGTGAYEGGADLKGKSKPLAFGHCYGVNPPLVNSASLIYQVHNGAISDVPYVWDRGVALTKVASAPAAGQYSVDTTLGCITLGSTPAGTITCNVKGHAGLSGYISTTAPIVQRILVAYAGLSNAEIDPASFVNLQDRTDYEVGIWRGTTPATVRSVVDDLLSAVGAFGGFDRFGYFTVGLIAAASGAPEMEFDETDIINLSREPLPPAVSPIVWRSGVGYQKNYTVQNDLAAAVLAAQKTFAAEPVRFSYYESSTVLSQHKLAKEFIGEEGTFASSTDAATEALRRFNLWAEQRGLYRLTTRPKAMTIDLGSVVRVTHSRFGLSGGELGRVLGHSIHGSEVELMVLV